MPGSLEVAEAITIAALFLVFVNMMSIMLQGGIVSTGAGTVSLFASLSVEMLLTLVVIVIVIILRFFYFCRSPPEM